MAKKHLPDRLRNSPWHHTGSSAHRWDELESLMHAGALEAGTFHLANIKGSTAGIVMPVEFSGTNHDQAFFKAN